MTDLEALLHAMRVVPAGGLDVDAILVAGRHLRSRRRAAVAGVVVACVVAGLLLAMTLAINSTRAR